MIQKERANNSVSQEKEEKKSTGKFGGRIRFENRDLK
jgi:hypothetical protein